MHTCKRNLRKAINFGILSLIDRYNLYVTKIRIKKSNSIYKLFFYSLKNIVVYFLKNKKNDLALKKLVRC
jgi:hypothetical protein